MQIYSFGHLCFGIFASGLGAVLLTISLLAATKRKKFKTYEARKSLYSSLLCTLYGTWLTSSAFDPPHQTSPRSDITLCVLLAVMSVTFITSFLNMRRLTKDPTM